MTIQEAKELVDLKSDTRVMELQKLMIWEAANYQVITEQFARLAQTTQILLRFFHGVGHDVQKDWKEDKSKAKLFTMAQAAYDEARTLLGPVSMIKPSDIFAEIEEGAAKDGESCCGNQCECGHLGSI